MARAETALLEQLQQSDDQEGQDEVEEEVDEDANQRKAKKNNRQKQAKAALVDKLGDLGAYNPRELTAHIRKTFETFDEDGSGEISSSELADAFRSMGMEIPDEDVEEMAANADMDGDGVLGIEEFEDMVKKMIATVREQEPEPEIVAITTDPPLFLGLFPISDTYFQRNTVPLSWLSLQVARIMSAPAVVDECGQRVPGSLVFEAQRRNLVARWGPKTLQWSLMADRGGASIGMETRKDSKDGIRKKADDDENTKKSFKEMFPSNSPIPGGEGVSEDEQRHDMRNVILQFDVHSKFRLEPPKLVPDNAVPYSDVVVLVSILTNTLMMTLSHFNGTVNMLCTNMVRCPENLEIMSEGWVLALDLAEVSSRTLSFPLSLSLPVNREIMSEGWVLALELAEMFSTSS